MKLSLQQLALVLLLALLTMMVRTAVVVHATPQLLEMLCLKFLPQPAFRCGATEVCGCALQRIVTC